jgi:hypothetical protein
MTLFEVFYIDRNTGWALGEFSIDEGYQIGDVRFGYHKADAIALAKQLDPHKAVRVYDRKGRIQKTVVGH